MTRRLRAALALLLALSLLVPVFAVQPAMGGATGVTNVTPTDASVVKSPVTFTGDLTGADSPSDVTKVEIFVDDADTGSTVASGTQNVSGNSSYSIELAVPPGDYTYIVRLADADTGSFEFSSGDRAITVSPDLAVRDVNDTSTLVSDANATFLSDDGEIIEQQTTTGSLDTSVLSASRSYVVSLSAADYYDRRVPLDLSESESVYLLPKDAPSVSIEFELDDSTGDFGSNSVLIVERPLNESGNTSYKRVAGGRFGAANSVPLTLEKGVIYRLKVKNNQQTRVLGEYTATVSKVEPLPIGSVEIRAQQRQGIGFNAKLLGEGNSTYIRTVYVDSQQNTTELNVTITNATSGALISQTTTTDSVNGYVQTDPVPNATGPYEVTVNATRTGEDVVRSTQVGKPTGFVGTIPIDPRWSNLLGMVGIFAIGGLIVIIDSRAAAVVMSVVAVAFSVIGLVTIPSALLGASAAGALIWAVGRQL